MVQILLILGVLAPQEAAPPSGTMTLDGGSKATRIASVRVGVKLVHPGAGEVQMSLTVGDGAAAAWAPFREVTILDLPPGDGDKKVVLRLKDRRNSESAPVAATIRLDTTPPAAKLDAPTRVPGSDLRVAIESPDAVDLQFTENVAAWSAWEPFSTPKTIPLSSGAGPKQVFFRFRDDVGNESAPSRLVVEAQDPAAPAPVGIRNLSIGVRTGPDGGLELTAWVDAGGLSEMSAEVDKVEVLSRRPFASPWSAPIGAAEGPRRLLFKGWDAAGREHRAQATFRDKDAPIVPMEPAEQPPLPWRLSLLGGVSARGVGFDSVVTTGRRQIKHGPMAIFRMQGAYEVVGPLNLQLAAEWAGGNDVRIISGGLDVGVRFDVGRWGGVDLELGTELGFYYSTLDVFKADFESFNGAPQFRFGGTLGARISDALWAETLLDVRFARYRFTGDHLARDRDAGGWTPALMVGLSWRF